MRGLASRHAKVIEQKATRPLLQTQLCPKFYNAADIRIAAPLRLSPLNTPCRSCDLLLPWYLALPLGGATLHIVWHVGAGIGAHMMCVLLTCCRCEPDAPSVWLPTRAPARPS